LKGRDIQQKKIGLRTAPRSKVWESNIGNKQEIERFSLREGVLSRGLMKMGDHTWGPGGQPLRKG